MQVIKKNNVVYLAYVKYMSIFQHCEQISIVICYDFFSSFKSRFTFLSKFLFIYFSVSFSEGDPEIL